MSKSIVLVLILAIVVAVFAKDEKPDAAMPGVVELNNDNFDKTINSNNVLVEVYAPSFAPKYKSLGKLISSSSRKNDVIIAKLDGNKYAKLSKRLKVEGFPTILYFAKGAKKGEEYDGKMTVKALLDMLSEKLDK